MQNDTIRFIWAIGPKDPQNPDDIQKHEPENRGTRSVIILDTNEHQNVPTPSNVKIYEINVEKVIDFFFKFSSIIS